MENKIINESFQDAALKILADELKRADLRKYTCINGTGHSQIERDIVSKLTNYQAKNDKIIIDNILEILQDLANGNSDISYLRKEAKELIHSIK